MIIKTWILLTIFSTLIQYILAIKKTPHFIGFFLPAGFLLFAIYAWFDLSKVGLSMGILLSFMIPPVFLSCIFELIYWKSQWKERMRQYEKNKFIILNPDVFSFI